MDTLEQIASKSFTGTSFSGTVQYDLGVMQMYSGWAQPPSMLPRGGFQPQIGSAGYGHSPVPYAQNLPSTVDINSYGFHMPARIMPEPELTIRDMPASGVQLHIHEGEGGTAHLRTYNREKILMDTYSAAMLDFYLEQSGNKQIRLE